MDGEDPSQNHGHCRLHHYQQQDVATCLDQLSFRRSRYQRPVRIAFIGESTVRNQFTSLLRVIPDYDMKGKTNTTAFLQHHWWADRNVTSQLLNLNVAFYWRRMIDAKFIDEFREWNIPPYTSTPDFIVMGAIIHHMSSVVGVDDIEPLVKSLKQLKPILRQLSNITRIVWLIQAPGPLLANKHLSQHFSAKIPEYNQRVRTILKGSGVMIWDSGVPLGMEYSRSCSQNSRLNAYINHDCQDEIHHGYAVLEHSTQMLLNDICNRLIFPMYHSVEGGVAEDCPIINSQ